MLRKTDIPPLFPLLHLANSLKIFIKMLLTRSVNMVYKHDNERKNTAYKYFL